ncbi:MAG: hypothetical protein AAF367_12065 [Pseudomonadota bacterium]
MQAIATKNGHGGSIAELMCGVVATIMVNDMPSQYETDTALAVAISVASVPFRALIGDTKKVSDKLMEARHAYGLK